MSTSIIDPISCLDEKAQIIYEKQTEKELFFIIQINSTSAICPSCQNCSIRVHSRYCRNVDDLPISDYHVQFQILTHKWFCDNPDCPKSIFTERLSWLQPYKRKTNRLEKAIEKIAFSTNCLTAEKVCKASKSLLVTIHYSVELWLSHLKTKHLPFVGIDDFAFKKRMTYGTIFIDLITKKPIDLLVTRKREDVTEWLKSHSNIALITRDGSKLYAKAITEASPTITQVSDRWHILHQLFEAIKKTITSIVPEKWKYSTKEQPTSKEAVPKVPVRKDETRRIQNEEKRWERIQHVQCLYEQGYTVTAIQKKCQISRGTVYKDLRQKGKPDHKRASPYQKYNSLIHSLVLKKQTNNQIEKVCRSKRYTESLSTLNAMIAKERRSAKLREPKSYYFRQKIIKIIWDFEKKNHIERFYQLHPKLLDAVPELKVIDGLVSSFRNLFSEKSLESLECLMNQYNESNFSYVKSFINGLRQDLQAVKLSVQEEWSNGITEGHVNRLKMIKRIMYGRAGFSVLKNRVLYQFLKNTKLLFQIQRYFHQKCVRTILV